MFDLQNGNSHDTIDELVTPPGPVNFEHIAQLGDEFVTAQINAYIQANLARDTVLAANPMYPTIGTQEGFHIKVNKGGTGCTNNYTGDAINFQAAKSLCNNGAFGTIVHHEYGHHLVAVAGSGQGSYGEGMGDAMGVLISGVSGWAIGKNPDDCLEAQRDADNELKYPCSGGKYACAPLLSGCVWSTRVEFLKDPVISLDILRDLAINANLLHTGKKITPQIYIDWLVLDDDDGDLSNGTPHKTRIEAGFDAHNMTMTLPGGTNSGATVFTWTDAAPSDSSWEHSCNWEPPVPVCSGDYPQDAVDVAFIDASSGTGDVELTGDVTIAKLSVSRDVTLLGSAIPESTLQVKAFVIQNPNESADVTVTVDSATIKQPPAP